jgi:hypothetical protein
MPARYRRYRGSRWLVGIASTLAVLAVALLSGAVIGGVGVYIFNDALDPPPPGGATASKASAPIVSADPKAGRLLRRPAGLTNKLVGTAAPPLPLPPAAAPPDDTPPSRAAAAAMPPAEAQPAAAAPPQSSPAPPTAAAEGSQQNSAGHAGEKPSGDANGAAPAHAAANSQTAHRAALAKKRAAVASMRRPMTEAWSDGQAAAQRPVFDSYRRGDRDRQDSSQSFFGLFGQDRYSDRYNDRSNDRYNDRNDNWR